MPEALAIETTDLHKSTRVGFWGRQRQLLSGIHVTVPKGRLFGFIGQNGAGKSTTIKHLIGALTPDSGSVRINGECPRKRLSRYEIGYLPELPRLPLTSTPLEILRLHGELLGLDKAQRRRDSEQLLERVELVENGNQMLTHFSKGMLQRLSLATALLGGPQILILDEPMSGLDPYGRQLVREILQEQQRLGRTVFFSSHILSDIESLCENVCVIHQGKTVAQGDLHEILPQSTSISYQLKCKSPATAEEKLKLESLLQNYEYTEKGLYLFIDAPREPYRLAMELESIGLQSIELIKGQDSLEKRLQHLLSDFSDLS